MTETVASLTLSLLAQKKLSLNDCKTLFDAVGSAMAVLENRNDIRGIEPTASDRLVAMMKEDLTEYEHRATEEMAWCEQNKVRILTISDPEYPDRLRHCPDAPMVLFVRGKANLNGLHIVDFVGTRKCTPYGQDVVSKIVKDFAVAVPDITIVSGLAYGIDIAAHRAAIAHDITTVGVVAHGQDTLYPYAHRNEANTMATGNGAVVTEYFHGTRPEARNFLQRNRIIAGLSDASIIVESASHGGSLTTARIAQEYNREVFAVPGPINAEFSAGCNNLIRDNRAALITSAQDIIEMMQWQNAAKMEKVRQAGIERSMFIELSSDEQRIVDALKEHGDSQCNNLSLYTSLPISTVSSLLFSMEMKGIVKAMSGNAYHLIG